jgi:hypothetical protein
MNTGDDRAESKEREAESGERQAILYPTTLRPGYLAALFILSTFKEIGKLEDQAFGNGSNCGKGG